MRPLQIASRLSQNGGPEGPPAAAPGGASAGVSGPPAPPLLVEESRRRGRTGADHAEGMGRPIADENSPARHRR